MLLGLSLYAAANTAAHANANERMLWWAASVLCFVTPLLLAWIIVLDREVRLRRAAEIALKDHAAIQSALLDGIPQPMDLTERHEMLAELAQAKTEAEAANRPKSTLLASVSHEIRTPMNAITGMLELTLARCQLSDDERLQLVTAHNSALGLLSLIDDILDLSKMEASKFSIQPAPASQPALMQDTLLIFGPVAAQKGLPLRSEFGAGLARLVSNAVRFTDSGTIRARLFEPFEQVHGRSRQQAGGTGWGWRSASAWSARWVARSRCPARPGKARGWRCRCRWRLRMRRTRPRRLYLPPPSEPMAGCARRHARILVIDDHAPNRLLLQRQLEHLGHR